MHRHLPPILIATVLSAAIGSAMAQPPDHANGKPPMFGKGHPFDVGDLPPGRMRDRLDALPVPARERALDWLHRFDFPAADLDALRIDDEGAVFYVDPVPPAAAPGEEEAAGAEDPSTEQAANAADNAFTLHSRIDAPHVVYLDFDGHTISGTAWNGSTDPLYARPFDLDGNPSSFSEAERAAIAEIWHRVAEDFAPFDIDVTTEEPASFDGYTGRVLITSKTDANGRAMPSNSGGGVAYVGVWGRSDYATRYSPALVYYDNLAKGTTYIAEASAHEFGHNLGLSHDGNGSTTYYAGHGSGNTSWAPIMGNSYSNNVTQWSRGEYSGANNTQDDLAIIASGLDWAGDDHADDLAGATPLALQADGQVLVSNPQHDPNNLYPENKGVIDDAADQDLFVVSAGAGQLELTVNPAWDAFYRTSKRGANLDIQAQLLDASGQTLASSDPASDTHAAVSASVTAGTYYLRVSGVGNGNYSDYASAGQYFVAGSVPPGGGAIDVPPQAAFNYGCMDLSCSFSDASGDADGSIVARAWDFGDGSSSTERNPGHSFAAAGSYNVTLTVTDDSGLTGNISRTVTASAPNTAPTAGFGFSCSDLDCSFNDSSSDGDGSVVTWAWDFGDGSGSSTRNPGHAYAAAGTYAVTLTVTDDDGASNSTTRSVTVTAAPADTEAPVITGFSPADGAEVSGSVTLSAQASDNRGVVSVAIYTDGELRCSGTTSASCSWNLRKVSTGAHTVRFEAVDAAGNKASRSITINVAGSTKGGGKTSDSDSGTSTKGKGRTK
jgi:PKD repeat protein